MCGERLAYGVSGLCCDMACLVGGCPEEDDLPQNCREEELHQLPRSLATSAREAGSGHGERECVCEREERERRGRERERRAWLCSDSRWQWDDGLEKTRCGPRGVV